MKILKKVCIGICVSFGIIGFASALDNQGSQNGEFKLSNITVTAQNQISLEFTSELEETEDTQRVFKVVEKNNEFQQYSVKTSIIDEQNPNTIFLVFEELLPIDTEFKLTVISLLDIHGRNIESGIESFENFIIESDKLNYIYQEETGNIVIVNEDNTTTVVGGNEEDEEINSGEQEIQEQETQEEIGEELLSAGDEKKQEEPIDTVSAGEDLKKLPTTGTQHIFMFFLALLLGALSFVYKYKK